MKICKICKKLRCFLEKFTQLTKLLHDRRSRRSRQIPSLLSKCKLVTVFLLPAHTKRRLIFITIIDSINVKCYCYHLYGIIRDRSELRIVLLPMSAGWCTSPHLMINRQLTNQRSCIYTWDIAAQIGYMIVHY